MKKVYPLFLMMCIVLTMLFVLSGCNTSNPAEDDTQDSSEQEEPDESETENSEQEPEDEETPSTGEEEQVPPEVLYASVLEKYRTTLSQEDPGFSRGQGFGEVNYLCMYYDPSEIGYTFMDTNQDGTPEMLIGPVGSDTGFFDLYTAVEGTPILVAQSGERDRYYVCTDGTIANEGSYSGFSGINAYYTIGAQGQRILLEAVTHDYDVEYDVETYWYSTSSTSTDGAEEITWESAELICNKYEYVTIDIITPFISDSSPKPETTTEVTGEYDDIVGAYADPLNLSNYLFIGYLDESKMEAYATNSLGGDFTTKLYEREDNYIHSISDDGSYMNMDISQPGEIYIELYIAEYDYYDAITYVPYPEDSHLNPYYVG